MQTNADGGLTMSGCCCAGNIEVWLQRLVDGMQGTMKAIIKRAYRNVQEMSFEDFVFSHPAQVRSQPQLQNAHVHSERALVLLACSLRQPSHLL